MGRNKLVSAKIIAFPSQRTQERLLTKTELADRIRMSERWIEYRMSDENDPLPYVQWGRRAVRFRLSEVLAWQHNRRAAS